jgi:AcrR family transcriptional regulator
LTVRSENAGDDAKRRSFIEIARRAQIIDAAISVLADHGYNATSLAAIGVHLGISKGVISYHFGGKAELLQEVVASILHQAGEWMLPRVQAAPSFAAALKLYIQSNLEYIDEHRSEVFALTEVLSNARTTPGVQESFEQSRAEAITGVEAILVGGQRSGEFGPLDARTTATALRASIDAATIALRTDEHFDVVGYGAGLIDLFRRATRP